MQQAELDEIGKRAADEAIEVASEARKNIESIMTNVISNRVGLLRDLSTFAATLLAAAITLATVGPALINTPMLLFIGGVLAILAIIASFFARRQFNQYLQDTLFYEAYEFSDIASAARDFKREPGNEKLFRTFSQQLTKGRGNRPVLPKFADKADIWIGLIVLAAILASLVGILFDFSLLVKL